MNLVDTGPLVALIDNNQGKSHQDCINIADKLTGPMLTTVPCFTESMYLLGRGRGWQGQRMLWRFLEAGALLIHYADADAHRRMSVLMEKYRDTPMDLADASLVTAAEYLGLRRIFTLDSDFYVYRINDKHAFEVIP